MKPLPTTNKPHIDHLPTPVDSDEIEAVHGEKLVDDAVEEELPPTDPEPPTEPATRP